MQHKFKKLYDKASKEIRTIQEDYRLLLDANVNNVGPSELALTDRRMRSASTRARLASCRSSSRS